MEVKGIGMPDLLYTNGAQQQKVLAKEVIPQLQNVEVKVDISKEGMEALRKQVQEMPGAIDVKENLRMREILPKLQIDPTGTHYWKMAEYEGELLEKLKKVKGDEYTAEDIREIQLKVYNTCCEELEDIYEKGEREIYISTGLVDGKFQYHKVTKEEDFEYLKEAYERMQRKIEIFESIQQYRIAL